MCVVECFCVPFCFLACAKFSEIVVKPRFLNALFAAAILCGFLALPGQAGAAPEKESWLGLPVDSLDKGYAFKGGVAVELSKVKIQTTVPIEIGQAWITPDWGDWITEFRTSRVRVATTEIVARPSSLSRLGIVDGPSSRIVTKIEFSGLKLLLGTSSIVLPAGEMRFKPDGTLAVIRVKYENGSMVELAPKEGGKLSVLAQAGTFKWSVLPAFSFNGVVAQGQMTDDAVELEKIGAASNMGSVSGSLRLTAVGKYFAEGNFRMESVHIDDVVSRLYLARSAVTGFVAGNFKLSATGDTLDLLAQSVTIDGDYELRNGVIDKFGLMEGLRKNSPGLAGGGEVRFDRVTGKFSARTGQPVQADFQGLSSGALRGSANFSVQPNGVLKGSTFGSLVLPGGENISRNFDLSGTVTSPTLSTR